MTLPADLVTIPRIPIADVGVWDCLTGTTEFTPSMLASAVEASKDPGIGLPRLKPGHIDPRFDGEPLLGLGMNLALDGSMLLCDFAGLDPDVAAKLPFRYPDRSIEGKRNVTSPVTGKTYEFALTAVALLPGEGAVETLPDLNDLAIAASGMGVGGEVIAASRRIEFPPKGGSASTNDPKEKGMDPKALRAALGLAEDATDEQVATKLAESGFNVAPTASGDGDDDKDGEDGDEGDAPSGDPKPGTKVEVPEGMVLVDEETLMGLKDGVAVAASLKAERDEKERDETILASYRAGKFGEPLIETYRQRWDLDPEGTKAMLEALPAGLVPVDGERGIMASKGTVTSEAAAVDAIAASFGVANVATAKGA